MKGNFQRCFLSITTCKHLLILSNVKKTVASPSELMRSSVHGTAYKSHFVKALRLLYSMRNYWRKDYECCLLILPWVYDFLIYQCVNFDFFKLPRLWVRTIQRRVDGVHIIAKDFHTLHCGVYMTRMSVPDCPIFG